MLIFLPDGRSPSKSLGRKILVPCEEVASYKSPMARRDLASQDSRPHSSGASLNDPRKKGGLSCSTSPKKKASVQFFVEDVSFPEDLAH